MLFVSPEKFLSFSGYLSFSLDVFGVEKLLDWKDNVDFNIYDVIT